MSNSSCLDDKCEAAVIERVEAELDSLTIALVARIQHLGERYDRTLDALENAVEMLASEVARHLAAMGVE